MLNTDQDILQLLESIIWQDLTCVETYSISLIAMMKENGNKDPMITVNPFISMSHMTGNFKLNKIHIQKVDYSQSTFRYFACVIDKKVILQRNGSEKDFWAVWVCLKSKDFNAFK